LPGKKQAAWIIALLLAFASPSAAFADDTLSRSRTRLDLSGGVIRGEFADYSFAVPSGDSAAALSADRVINLGTALEKLDFFVGSKVYPGEIALVMSLYVFGKSQWDDNYSLKVITRSRDYVFAAYFETLNPFFQPEDRANFANASRLFSGAEYVRKRILLPDAQLNEYRMTPFVNGASVSGGVKYISGAYYVPLRACAEALGYKIEWIDAERTVSVSRGSFRHSFAVVGGAYFGKGYVARIIDDRTYVSTSFVLRVLNKNVEIDEAGNVFMFS
jgi:hypothetical protein